MDRSRVLAFVIVPAVVLGVAVTAYSVGAVTQARALVEPDTYRLIGDTVSKSGQDWCRIQPA
jgi:hypothetical protein